MYIYIIYIIYILYIYIYTLHHYIYICIMYILTLFKSNTFISNIWLKLEKNSTKTQQHSQAELLLFENYLLSSCTSCY